MKENIYLGLLILFEGIDGSGKTIAAKEAIKKLRRLGELKESDICYLKGVGSSNFIGKIARRFPCTLLFCLELMYHIFWQIRPALKKGKIVFQDRYFFSIASHLPQVEKKFNKMLLKIAERFVIKPDLIFYFTVSRDEQIKRLKKSSATNRFHKKLIDNPDLALSREKKYLEMFNPYKSKTIIIDSAKLGVEEISENIKNIILGYAEFRAFNSIIHIGGGGND